MTGRRAIVGLSLLCALVFCAFAAPNAMALKGTTAFTCVKDGGATDFAAGDSHCRTHVTPGTGEYGHVEIKPETTTEVHVTNAKTSTDTAKSTPATLKAILGGVEVDISCETVGSTGSLKNTETAGKQMEVEGTAAKVVYTECKATKPFNGGTGKERCLTHSPGAPVGEIIANATTTTYVVENAKKEEEMGVRNNQVGGAFTEIVLENNGTEKCSIAGTYKVTGNAYGTPTNNAAGQDGSGATLHYIAGEQELKLGEAAAELTQTLTISMAPAKVGDPTGNPISLTTTTT